MTHPDLDNMQKAACDLRHQVGYADSCHMPTLGI
jgi:Holliday junction resolvase RusA-like endonuclease